MNVDAELRPRTSPWNRRAISLAAPVVMLLVLLLVAPDVPLVIFAGMLLAVLINACGGWIAGRLEISRRLGIGAFLLLTLLALSGFFVAFVPAIMEQADDFVDQAPAAIEALRGRIADFPWLQRLLDRVSPSALVSSEGGALAVGAASSTFGAFGNFAIVLFIGVACALDPKVYRRGVQTLLAPSLRPRAVEVMDKVDAVVRGWLTAKLIAMALVGIFTGLGLWLAGVPLPLLLGFIAGLLAFIPNLGPVLAAAPAILLAVPQGGQTVLLVVAVFVTVQTLESYAVTPLLQQKTVSLPPALIIAVQLMMGILFGLLGLLLATPVAAVAMTLFNEIYVDDYLETEGRRD